VHVDPGVLLLLDRLADTPAHCVGPIGEMLWQTSASKSLIGDLSRHGGPARSGYFRWFLDPCGRERFAPVDHRAVSAEIVANLRHTWSGACDGRAVRDLVAGLLERSAEFAALWRSEEIAEQRVGAGLRRFVHPSLGPLELQRTVLFVAGRSQRVMIYHAVPGSADHTILQLLSVVGHHRFDC
jgi:hypothetical protein